MNFQKFEPVKESELSTEQIKRTGLKQSQGGQNPASINAVSEDEAFEDPSAFANAPVPQRPQRQNTTAARETPTEVARQIIRSRNESTTIQRLRKAFGTDVEAPIEETFADAKWTFRVPGSIDIQWAISMVQEMIAIGSDLLFTLAMNRALVAISVAAIDDVPLFAHFDVPLPEGANIENPLNPPARIRLEAAERFYAMLSHESVDDLSAGLSEIYKRRVEPRARRANAPLAETPPSPPSTTT